MTTPPQPPTSSQVYLAMALLERIYGQTDALHPTVVKINALLDAAIDTPGWTGEHAGSPAFVVPTSSDEVTKEALERTTLMVSVMTDFVAEIANSGNYAEALARKARHTLENIDIIAEGGEPVADPDAPKTFDAPGPR